MTDRTILGMRLDATSYADASARVVEWARRGESRMVCCANVHMVMEAHDHADFASVLATADLVTADGMPLAWALRLLGVNGAPRVYGPQLILEVCAAAEAAGTPIALFGSTPETLERLTKALARRFPSLRVAWRSSPPFRALTEDEDATIRRELEASGARILFVGLGCPKQERWMAAQRGRLPAVMLGVGAAFDFHAGVKRQAPAVLGTLGLEWVFRLATEPRRLWRRYLHHNPRFVAMFTLQLARAAAARLWPTGGASAATQEPKP